MSIGTLQERSLHAALKRWYAQPDDRFEVPVDGFIVDLVRGDLLIEIQTRNFSSLKRKLAELVERHRLRLVYPIPLEKWIVRVSGDGQTVLSRRRSPRRGCFEDLFHELVSFPQLVTNPNFSLEVLLIREEEVRHPFQATHARKRRRRWRRAWTCRDRKLIEVVARRVLESPADYRAFLPPALRQPFSNQDLASALSQPHPVAQKITYCLCRIGTLQLAGKRGRAHLYADAAPLDP